MKGKIPAVLFKALALVSALAIGGGYVAWRGGEARKAEAQKKKEETPLMVGTKNPSGTLLTRDEIDGVISERNDFSQPIPGIPEGSEGVSNIVPLLPGSKSISMPLFTKEQIKELPPVEEDTELELLPSSKIGILRLPKKEAEPPKKKDPKLLPSSKSIDSILKDLVPEKSE